MNTLSRQRSDISLLLLIDASLMTITCTFHTAYHVQLKIINLCHLLTDQWKLQPTEATMICPE